MKTSIQEASGKLHKGVHVHGCNDRQSLDREIRRASRGQTIARMRRTEAGSCPACVRTAGADVDERFVDLRNAVIVCP